ncbi:fibroblast growth factor 23 [Eucyclogobius newberryi]|uniref:fibroblast growth factor 23 n=1 Tax=Eucyclogobius newberryi TaxID=166745 RepID=UPI003B5B8ECD
MNVYRGLGLRDTVLALVLALLRLIPFCESVANPSPLVGSNWGNPRRYVHLQTSTDLNNFYLEIREDGSVRKSTVRGAYSVILLKSDTRERIAILGIKSSRYLCMDTEGTPFSSPICLREDCLFNHRLLENNKDVYYSSRTGILFNLEGSRQVFSAGQNLPQTSQFLSRKNTVPLERLMLHRDKRNQLVNPSDPHNVYVVHTEDGADSRALPELDDVEFELEVETEAGDDGRNVSRETPLIPNVHDPWNVHAVNPSSPRSAGNMG